MHASFSEYIVHEPGGARYVHNLEHTYTQHDFLCVGVVFAKMQTRVLWLLSTILAKFSQEFKDTCTSVVYEQRVLCIKVD